MVNLISRAVLDAGTDLADPEDYENRVLNDISRFIAEHQMAPRYLYVNDRQWAISMFTILPWTDELGIEVIDNPYQPPRLAFTNHNRYSYKEIAAFCAKLMEDEEESILSGTLNIL